MQRRILYIDNTAWHFVNHRNGLAREALRSGFEVHLAVPKGDEIPSALPVGVSIHRYPLSRRGINPLTDLATLWELTRIVRHLRPRLIHSLTLKPVLYGTLASLAVAGTRVINGVTGLGFMFTADALQYRAARRAFLGALGLFSRNSDVAYIFQHSGDVAPFLSARAIRPGGFEIIPGSGVEISDFDTIPENAGPPAVLMACRLLWDKGVEDYVAAARKVQLGVPSARFILAGDSDAGNPECIPRDIVEKWNREGPIEWVGWQGDIRKMLAQADIVCLPSRNREGVPRILVEAAAAGRTIVTTDVPGCRDVVLSLQTGNLVPPRDPDRLAAVLSELLNHRSQTSDLGRKAREAARMLYSSERINAATIRLYERMLQPI